MPLINKTKSEKRCLDFIVTYMKRSEVAPSYREVRSALGYSNISTVYRLIMALGEKGWLKLTPGRARSMMPTDAAFDFYSRLASVRTPAETKKAKKTTGDIDPPAPGLRGAAEGVPEERTG